LSALGRWLVGLLWLGLFGVGVAQPVVSDPVRISQAYLVGQDGTREVSLPHKLDPGDFDPRGSVVRYRLNHRLTSLPEQPLGLFVGKVSLAGRLSINGQSVGGCEVGELSRLRCLHKPYLFKPPLGLWRIGDNLIEFEVYADDRQMNGLSAPVLGDVERLDRELFSPQYLLRVESIHMLTWASLTLGLLALAVGLMLRSDSAYLWFGLASITNAMSNLNVLVSQPAVSVELFSWFAFSARMVSAPFLLLTFAAFFGPTPRWLRLFVLAYVIGGPLAVALSGNNRWVAVAMYLPILAMAAGFAVFMVRESVRSRQWGKRAVTGLYLVLLAFGAVDFARLGGATPLEGVYLIAYAHSVVMLVIGITLLTLLASAFRTARDFNVRLEREVAQRTVDLEAAYQALTEARIERSRIDERERLLQDMHDGFGSQLASARLMAEQGRIGPTQLSQLLQECIADLYLVADTLTGTGDSIADAMVDLRSRTERRLAGSSLRLVWNIELDEAPAIPQRVMLQLLRIVQEALNNALKHAGATTIRIDAIWSSSQRLMSVSVADDGQGFATPFRRGRGLNNMQRRCREIGADLQINRLDPGTAITLTLHDRAWVDQYPEATG
jgi:signal transduction histidine kinase